MALWDSSSWGLRVTPLGAARTKKDGTARKARAKKGEAVVRKRTDEDKRKMREKRRAERGTEDRVCPPMAMRTVDGERIFGTFCVEPILRRADKQVKIDPRSFRWVPRHNSAWILFGCPSGSYNGREAACEVGTRGTLKLRPLDSRALESTRLPPAGRLPKRAKKVKR